MQRSTTAFIADIHKVWQQIRLGLIVKLSHSHGYPGSGVVLDCIDS